VVITVSCEDIHRKTWSHVLQNLYVAPELLTYGHEKVVLESKDIKRLE